jgi:hypothetical protein
MMIVDTAYLEDSAYELEVRKALSSEMWYKPLYINRCLSASTSEFFAIASLRSLTDLSASIVI